MDSCFHDSCLLSKLPALPWSLSLSLTHGPCSSPCYDPGRVSLYGPGLPSFPLDRFHSSSLLEFLCSVMTSRPPFATPNYFLNLVIVMFPVSCHVIPWSPCVILSCGPLFNMWCSNSLLCMCLVFTATFVSLVLSVHWLFLSCDPHSLVFKPLCLPCNFVMYWRTLSCSHVPGHYLLSSS